MSNVASCLSDKPVTEDQEFDDLLGRSVVMVALRRQLLRVAAAQHNVLVTGPTGAGKELVVRSIHLRSDWADEPFFDINCGAIPEPLMESQLFGHERGAFTGADRRQEGVLSAVRNGTLFLDEIAELPLTLQAKLLRVLQERRFRPVGSLQEQPFRGRVVAATHGDLRHRVAARQFREDLYYRLQVLSLEVPPLEQRRDDIPRLVQHFAAAQARPIRFTSDALDWLMLQPWPGNVRELRHFVDRVAVFSDENVVSAQALRQLAVTADGSSSGAATERTPTALPVSAPNKLRAAVHALVDEAMLASGGNKSAAAKLLGVHRKVIERICFARVRPELAGGDGLGE